MNGVVLASRPLAACRHAAVALFRPRHTCPPGCSAGVPSAGTRD